MSVLARPADRIHLEWRNRVIAEYTSAAITARVLHLTVICGLDRPLQDTALRIVRDELDHAALSDEARLALGDTDEPLGLEVGRLDPPRGSDGPLAELVDHVCTSFCFGETLAVPLFAAMRARADHPAIQPVLTRVLADEAVHRGFGWDALDALLALDPDGVRARAATTLPTALQSYRAAYHDIGDGSPLTAEELSAGLLPHGAYREVFRETVLKTIVPRLGSRGIALDHGLHDAA